MTAPIAPSATECLVVPTGSANLASVRAGLRRAGSTAVETENVDRVATATTPLVLPGVGAFGPAMDSLTQRGLAAALRARIAADLPTLAVCVGLQLLLEASDEAPGVAGLGIVPNSKATRFDAPGLRVPQLGWNRVTAPSTGKFLAEDGYASFANSFRLTELSVTARDAGFRVATCDYGGRFVAGFEHSNLVACQFHPELSSAYGARILERFIRNAKGTRPC